MLAVNRKNKNRRIDYKIHKKNHDYVYWSSVVLVKYMYFFQVSGNRAYLSINASSSRKIPLNQLMSLFSS